MLLNASAPTTYTSVNTAALYVLNITAKHMQMAGGGV